MNTGRRWKFVLAAVSVVFLIVLGSVFITGRNKTEEGKLETKKEPIKRPSSPSPTPSHTKTGHFETKLVKDKYLLVRSELTWEKFGKKLSEGDESFVESFSKLFNDLAWTGVFFECKAFKPSTGKSETVEFRLVKTSRFDGVGMDHSAFDEKFKDKCPGGTDAAISFMNLSKDSTLVSPCPVAKLNATHIKVFMKTASLEQRKVLLAKVGETLVDKLASGGDEKIWLSTSGLAVSWLHVRFDPSPEYYQTKEYK